MGQNSDSKKPASRTVAATKRTSAKTAAVKKTVAKATSKAAAAKKTSTAKKAAEPKKATAKKAAEPKKAAQKKAVPAKKEAPAKAPAKKAKPASLDKFSQSQKELLLKERQEHLDQAEKLKAEADRLAQEMEPGDSDFGEEGGEGGTLSVDRERDLALSAQARAIIEDIDDALAKIDAGTYGICESCGKPILKDRLRYIPYARLCVACKTGGLIRR